MQSTRRRAAATGVAALFAAMPFTLGAVAYADGPVQESGSQVTFSGSGLLGVTCDAKPSASTVTVPAESSLRVVNNTGRRAKLLLDGATSGEIGNGAAADVLFHRGPVELALKPDCVLADESAVRVEVVAAPRGTAPAAPAAPAAGPPASSGGSSGGSSSSSTSGSSMTRGGSTQTQTQNRANAAPTPGAGGEAVPDAEPTPEPGTETAAATIDGGDLTGGDPAWSDPTTVSGAAAEPLASVEPVSESGKNGLLALIATVCVVGVSAGAIRAIIAQRATRTRVA
jgi:hypothetical protein